ncbi:glycosyltransferase [Chryseobacterium koreense]|uniref:glycosyltransferase family 2 protein n=1 Tax=Chryseobacterium koreense TaxID=232216 RepID=UPI0026EB4231|nr:glycosyltransferase [Chryseobacterium koreense]
MITYDRQPPPLLSIIVPIFKVEEFLEECIDSILIQGFQNYELILVNDGSPDGCGKICDDYAAKDSRIKVIHKTNGGLSSARNAGIEFASGRYLSFIDSDDFVSVDYFKENMQYLVSHPEVDMLVAQVCHYDKVKNTTRYQHANLLQSKAQVLEYLFSADYIASAWINIYQSNIFRDVRFPEGRIYEDGYILPQIADRAEKVYISDQGIYYYRRRENSITSNRLHATSYRHHLDSYHRIIEYAVKKGISKKIYCHYVFYYSHILFNAVRDYSTQEYEGYITFWHSYPFSLFDAVRAKSVKSSVEFLLLKITGFKVLSKLFGP